MNESGIAVALPSPPTVGRGDALFLDFDGTLTEIAETPDDVAVDPRVPALLNLMSRRLEGALAVVSGRPLAQLVWHLRPFDGALAGLHGLERRTADGKWLSAAPLPELEQVRRLLTGFANAHPGVVLEDKGATLALHYRANPALGRMCREIAHSVSGGRLVAVPGKMVVEILPKGFDKAGAIEAFLSDARFQGRRPIYVGDDRPDEAGFDYVNRLGGISILIGSPPIPSNAQFQLADVASVVDWLNRANAELLLAESDESGSR